MVTDEDSVASGFWRVSGLTPGTCSVERSSAGVPVTHASGTAPGGGQTCSRGAWATAQTHGLLEEKNFWLSAVLSAAEAPQSGLGRHPRARLSSDSDSEGLRPQDPEGFSNQLFTCRTKMDREGFCHSSATELKMLPTTHQATGHAVPQWQPPPQSREKAVSSATSPHLTDRDGRVVTGPRSQTRMGSQECSQQLLNPSLLPALLPASGAC